MYWKRESCVVKKEVWHAMAAIGDGTVLEGNLLEMAAVLIGSR